MRSSAGARSTSTTALLATDPAGKAHLPWLLDHKKPTLPAGRGVDRLNNLDTQGAVDGAVRPALEQWLNSNSSVAEGIAAMTSPRSEGAVLSWRRSTTRRAQLSQPELPTA